MNIAPSIIGSAKERLLNKDPSQRSIGLLTDNNEIYNGELFLEIIKPFIEGTKNKVKALLFGDELEIASVFGKKKADSNGLVNEEQIKKMTAYTNLLDIKKNSDFETFKNIFSKVKKEYEKDKNVGMLQEYLNQTDLDDKDKKIFIRIAYEIINNVLKIQNKYVLVPGGRSIELYNLSLIDNLFKLSELNFNI